MMNSAFRMLTKGHVARRILQTNSLEQIRPACHVLPVGSRRFGKSAESSSTSTYAVVDHSEAYETAMKGLHGEHLALAKVEGKRRNAEYFDPFVDEESDDNEESDESDVVEAEYVDDGDESEDEDEVDSIYNNDGSLKRSKTVLATLRAGFPSGGQFAVIKLGGHQHKVTTDDLLVVNKLKPVEKYKIGSVHTLTDIMLVASSHKTLVGMPYVPGAEVDVMVEEITRDKKVIVFKKRRRKHSQRKNGFRRDLTLLRVLDVRFPEDYRGHYHVTRDIVDELDEEKELDTLIAS